MTKIVLGGCCGEMEAATQHPDHSNELNRISRISGQVQGIKRMISEREYCPKIVTQIQAVRAALKSLESRVLEKHLSMCVNDAIRSRNQGEADEKLAELMKLFRHS